jgi:integrase
MMTDWYERTIKALQLNGKGERTQECYARAVRMLSEFYEKTPDLVSEEELQKYFLHRKNVNKWAPNTMHICYCGIRFFFEHVLKRDWQILNLIRAQNERRLPAVLSIEEVRSILNCINTFHNYTFLTTVYSCGLRLQEAMYLEVSDIDGDRMMIHVHRGKGAKDRYVPLPNSTLTILRNHWLNHRNSRLIFPAVGRNGKAGRTPITPMAKSSVQGAFRRAKKQAGIHKRRVSVHTLRHSFATHHLQDGYDIRTVQELLGHKNVKTTMIYLHVLKSLEGKVISPLEKL